MMYGEIWWVDFGIPFGSETGFHRPAVVVQNNVLNISQLNTTVIVPITSNLNIVEYKGNVFLPKNETGLPKDSVAVTPQIVAVDHARFDSKISVLSVNIMKEIEENIMWTVGQ